MWKAIIFIFTFLLLVGCSLGDVQHDTDLEESIYSIVEGKSNDEIRIKSLTTFDCKKAYLFTPYSTKEDMQEQLGDDFKDPSNIDRRDDIYLLVFLYEGEVVQYVEIERQGTDFTIGEKRYLATSDDIIHIERY